MQHFLIKIDNFVYINIKVIILKNKKKRKINRTIVITLIIIQALIVFFYLYKMYKNTEIVDNYTAERTQLSTNIEQNVENIKQKSQSTADMIEKVTKSVCGISKLSNAGSSIY